MKIWDSVYISTALSLLLKDTLENDTLPTFIYLINLQDSTYHMSCRSIQMQGQAGAIVVPSHPIHIEEFEGYFTPNPRFKNWFQTRINDIICFSLIFPAHHLRNKTVNLCFSSLQWGNLSFFMPFPTMEYVAKVSFLIARSHQFQSGHSLSS